MRNREQSRDKTDSSDEISAEDFEKFLKANSFEEQLEILKMHSRKNQRKLKKMRRKEKMENQEEKKEGFFKKAFREMGENARAQHEVDKAKFEAIKAESKANFEENRGANTLKRAKANAKQSWDDAHMSLAERTARVREEQAKQIEEANARKIVAEERMQKSNQERK